MIKKRYNLKHFQLNILSLVVFFILAVNSVFSQSPTPDIFSPTFSHMSGRYNSDILVQLNSRTQNADIYYTLDGSEPDTSSQKYANNVLIAGDGNFKVLKTIAIKQDTMKSVVSSATYIIDYNWDPNAVYLSNLTLAQYHNLLQGDWFGYTANPWTDHYCITLSILPSGNYIDTTTSSGNLDPNDDIYSPVFYYGVSNISPLKTITLINVAGTGIANGLINVDLGLGTIEQNELREVQFIDNKNLYFEMWHQSIFGPIQYYLTKKNANIPTGISEYKSDNTLIYPNPASDFIFIKNLNSNVQFINQLGESITLKKNDLISVSHLPKGLYTLLYQNSDGIQIKQKLVLE